MSRGDHIKVQRFGYWHHGIDLGEERVIHFCGELGQKSNAQIKVSTLDDFLMNGKLCIVEYSSCFDAETVITSAESLLGQKDYSLFFNNCEHFARYCKIGEKKSEQVDAAVTGISAGSAVTGVSTIGATTVVSVAGTVAGLSGPGITSGLATIGAPLAAIAPIGAMVGGIITLGAIPSAVANIAVSKVLSDDENLAEEEKRARSKGRIAAKIGTGAGTAGVVAAIYGFGATGLSGPAIMSGLAAIGGTAMTGVAITVAAPAVITAIAGFGVYKLCKWKTEKGSP